MLSTRRILWPALALVAMLAAGSALAQTQLVVWHQEQPPHRVERWNQLAAMFNEQYPEFEVELQVQDWDEVYRRLAAAAAAGREPDVLFVIPDFALTVQQLGLGLPVTELVEALDTEHSFIEAALEPYRHQEEYWAVPLYGMVQVLWYRKDIFDEAGITEPPQTWDELVEVARELTTDERHGIAVPAGRNLASDQVIYSFMITAGAEDLFDEQCNVIFDTPETVKTLALYRDLLEVSPPDATAFAWGEPQALFNAGLSAMAIEKGQYLKPFEEESGRPADDLGMVRIPQPAVDGQDGTIYYSNAAMVLTEDPAKQEAAEAFLRFLLDADVYGDFLTAEPGLFIPVTHAGLEAEGLWADPTVSQYRDYVEEMIAYSEHGALFGFTSGIVCEEIAPISALNLLAQTIQQMITADLSPEEAAAWGQERMEAAARGD